MAKPHVLIQVGHDPPHHSGHEGETGAAGELELVRKIGKALMKRLNAERSSPSSGSRRPRSRPA